MGVFKKDHPFEAELEERVAHELWRILSREYELVGVKDRYVLITTPGHHFTLAVTYNGPRNKL